MAPRCLLYRGSTVYCTIYCDDIHWCSFLSHSTLVCGGCVSMNMWKCVCQCTQLVSGYPVGEVLPVLQHLSPASAASDSAQSHIAVLTHQISTPMIKSGDRCQKSAQVYKHFPIYKYVVMMNRAFLIYSQVVNDFSCTYHMSQLVTRFIACV